jgi:hypothetical protein
MILHTGQPEAFRGDTIVTTITEGNLTNVMRVTAPR